MKTILLTSLASGVVAFAAATWVYSTPDTAIDAGTGAAPPGAMSFDPTLSLSDRIRMLEQAISDERMARQLLQDEVLVLTAELEALQDSSIPSADIASTDEQSVATSQRRERSSRGSSGKSRFARLVDAGFDEGMANWIVEREQAIQMESLQTRFDSDRSGESPDDWYRQRLERGSTLRAELGDVDYERYLEANGRPTNITVSSVLGSSPAQTAGLQAGDQILRYDGARTFSMSDVTRATMQGTPGQSVVLDIMRDGVPMQVVIPRGPLGITGGRSRR